MSHTKASLQGQDKETLEDILWTWKIIQASPDCWVTMHEANEMVRLITNELRLKELSLNEAEQSNVDLEIDHQSSEW